MKTAYLYLHCDAWKSFSSMNPTETNNLYSDTKQGRAALLTAIEADIDDGAIEVDNANLTKVHKCIIEGNPLDANDFISYGVIIKYYIR